MKQDRFLLGILIGIGVLAALSLALFFTRQNRADYVADDTPQGVLKNYVLALQKQDYTRAYGYLAQNTTRPDSIRFRNSFSAQQFNISDTSIEVGDPAINGDNATVAVTVIRSGGGLFSGIERMQQEAMLVRQGGAWKISNFPYPYWSYDWSNPEPKVVPPAAP